MKEKILVGIHASTAQGVFNACYQAANIGATTFQIFTSNQRQWKAKKYTEEEVNKFKQAKKGTGIDIVMSHASYLINLGSAKEELLKKSKEAFLEEIKRCHLLDITYLNFHPGSATGQTEEKCLKIICKSLNGFAHAIAKGKTKLLVETTAGQGSNMGSTFEQLAYILEHTHIPLGVCIDTCHIFSAGYDIRTEKAWEKTLKEFDRIIGLKHLKAFHLNDSAYDLGLRRDRHKHLGEGKIGLESFAYLMQNPKTRHLPKYLETPLSDKWANEIALLKEMAEDV